MTHPELIVDQSRLDEIIPEICDQPSYAMDTEFHRERTYYPKVALVQINWGAGMALIDPLAVSLAPLAEVLDGPGLAVMHASSQDLEVLTRACGTLIDPPITGVGLLDFHKASSVYEQSELEIARLREFLELTFR